MHRRIGALPRGECDLALPRLARLTIWRIHYRSGKTRLVDDAELERLDGLKRRTYVGVEKAKMHICTACGREGAWDDGWGWYGSIEQIDNWQGEKPQIPKWCSTNCMEALKVAGKIPKRRAGWMRRNPLCGRDSRALPPSAPPADYKAVSIRRSHLRQATRRADIRLGPLSDAVAREFRYVGPAS